jgi:hypothetical protein
MHSAGVVCFGVAAVFICSSWLSGILQVQHNRSGPVRYMVSQDDDSGATMPGRIW